MKNFRFIFVLYLLTTIYSCSKKEIIPTNVEVQNFVWKGLNTYYLWQNEVPNLSDRRFASDEQLNNFLAGYSNSANLFKNLLYKRSTVDKWSWIVDDYTALENALEGTTQTTGMEFGLVRFKDNKSNLFGYVRYVVPKTEASLKNVKRGMIFTQIDGTQLTTSNYKKLLFLSANSYIVNFANYNNGNPTTNGVTIHLTKKKYTENPVYKSKIFTIGSKKIGYIMYNGFISNFDDELNSAFGRFKAEKITDLIVDLRYNGGGSVRTATYLASMITGQFNDKLFAKQRWNSKVEKVVNPTKFINNFTNEINKGATKKPINSLHLNNVYFITTKNSASASELVINGLIPYINVKKVGTKTHGKYVGSITLYDSPTYTKKVVNPNHKWAMQPIVLEIVNKDGNSVKGGLIPNNFIEENYGNLGVLGDKKEPLLARTISFITIGKKRTSGSFRMFNNTNLEIDNSKLHTPTSNNMYVKLK